VPRDDPYGSSTACPCCLLILSYLAPKDPLPPPPRPSNLLGQRRAAGAMVTLTSLLTSSPLHVLLVEVFTRYLKNYGEWPAISRVCLLCVGLG